MPLRRVFAFWDGVWDPVLQWPRPMRDPSWISRASRRSRSWRRSTCSTASPQTHLRRVVDIGLEEQYRTSATIFGEGSPGDKFYLIVEGAVRISRFVPGMGEEALAVLRAGAYFGEMSLIDDAPRSATAVCHERCRLFVVNRKDLEDLLFVDRDLA